MMLGSVAEDAVLRRMQSGRVRPQADLQCPISGALALISGFGIIETPCHRRIA